jgi:hypothetical protein
MLVACKVRLNVYHIASAETSVKIQGLVMTGEASCVSSRNGHLSFAMRNGVEVARLAPAFEVVAMP